MDANQVVIVTPVYDDWGSFATLLQEIDQVLSAENLIGSIIAVDDGSTQSHAFLTSNTMSFSKIIGVEIVNLVYNIGSQKAITIGLAHAHERHACPVIVMDSDGEDRPSDIPGLLKESRAKPDMIVFAHRARRSEGLLFVIFYMLYRLFFRLLTGKNISFGNFCIIPASLMQRLVYLPQIWNHFAVGVIRSGLPWHKIPTVRGRRYNGKSKMSFISLVIHGLSAISVYVDIAAVRLIVFSLGIVALVMLGFTVLLYIRFLTPLAIPGWATNVAIGLVVTLFQAILFLTSVSFLILNLRSNKLFIPIKDYKDFILNVEMVQTA